MCVGNHVGMIDAFTLTAIYNPSYLSNYNNKHIYPFGTFATNVQCLWVKRAKDSRIKIIKSITERMKNYREHPDLYSPLCILPEGTVTNGLGLL